MTIKSKKRLNKILKFLPYIIFSWAGNRATYAYRTAPDGELSAKLNSFLSEFMKAITIRPLPSFQAYDLLGGIIAAAIFWYILWDMRQKKRKLRSRREHGSAELGTEADIESFRDYEKADNNLILTQSEWLTMGVGNATFDRNKNVLVIGGPGTAKTLGFVKPNIMQMHPKTCYVVTDPKGSVLRECGNMLSKGKAYRGKDGKTRYRPYKIKVFNSKDFSESMHYNPFHYFREDFLQEDITKFIDIFMENTNGGKKQSGNDPFWEKSEKMLYTAYIALIFTVFDEEYRNIKTLCDLVTNSSVSEDEKAEGSKVDLLFRGVEEWINGELTGEKSQKYKGVNFSRDPDDREK